MKLKNTITKISKKTIPLAMAGAMLAQTATPVLAAQTESQDIPYAEASAGTQKDAVVKAEKNSEFTVTIPKTIMLDSNDAADYTVKVKGSVLADESVTVAPHDNLDDVEGVNFKMAESTGKKADAVATAVQNDTLWSSAEITAEGTEKTGNITAEGITAGAWEGNLTFDINMNAADVTP